VSDKEKVQFTYEVAVSRGQTAAIQKIAGYTVSLNHENTQLAAENVINEAHTY
jgi:maltose phosphorylase